MRRLAGDAVDAPALVLTPAWAATAGAGAASMQLQAGSSGFDANMVIILAALLCVLICALGLSSLVRCALQCARGLSPATGSPVPAAATAGLKKKKLRRIPVEVYGAKAGVPDTECAICLGDFADGDKVRVLPRCHHGFHVRCIDTWLAAHTSCPTCRDSIISLEGGVAGADATPTTAGGGQRWRVI